jgi:hypothetical protein
MPETATLTELHPYKVGDILINSWGWEQTNIDAYQVVKATGKSVTIRQIATASVANHNTVHAMTDTVVPVPDDFRNSPTQVKYPKRYSWGGTDQWFVNFTHGGSELHVEGTDYHTSSYA